MSFVASFGCSLVFDDSADAESETLPQPFLIQSGLDHAEQRCIELTKCTSEPSMDDPWLEPNDALPAQRTSSFPSVIQEVVDRSDWEQGSSIVIMLTGNRGRRVAVGFNGGAAPELYIRYKTSPPSN